MTERNDDPTLVTLNRSREHADAQLQPQPPRLEKEDFNVFAAALAAGAPSDGALVVADAAAGTTAATVQVPSAPADVPGGVANDAYRKGRLGMTAGLVVLLVVVWIWQRRGASAR